MDSNTTPIDEADVEAILNAASGCERELVGIALQTGLRHSELTEEFSR